MSSFRNSKFEAMVAEYEFCFLNRYFSGSQMMLYSFSQRRPVWHLYSQMTAFFLQLHTLFFYKVFFTNFLYSLFSLTSFTTCVLWTWQAKLSRLLVCHHKPGLWHSLTWKTVTTEQPHQPKSRGGSLGKQRQLVPHLYWPKRS